MSKVTPVVKNHIKPGKWTGLLLAALCLNSTSGLLGAYAQGPSTPGTAQPSGQPQSNPPVDIQASEQEFAGDHVIAKGNVRVNYKGTIVTAPQATLVRDAQGQPQMAVFTGHAYLVQESNKMDADKLTFMMSNSEIIADGNAHSEVVSGDEDASKKPNEAKPGAKPAAKPTAKSAPAATASSSKTQDKNGWQTDDDADGGNSNPESKVSSDNAISGAEEAEKPKTKPPEKIYTDADHQIFEQDTGHFEATGHVHVRHGDIKVESNHLQLVYGVNKKPETALFTGNVSATQNLNRTKADAMTYFLPTQRLQATGNVRSKVIQEKQGTTIKKGEKSDTASKSSASADTGATAPLLKTKANSKKLAEQQGATFVAMDMNTESDEPVYILSDSQDYTKDRLYER
jgi:lipopolysaccharide export system protein LptA